MKKHPTFSIVVNTLNRGHVIENTLNSFRWLKYAGEFEVIVVNGPSNDNTDQILTQWRDKIRVGKCDFANLSISRNIGICMAQGDIVCFIDDDAIPEPEWLSQLAEAYADPSVGAAGGFVYNHTGYDFQYKYCLVDRFGNADLSPKEPTPYLSFPKSYSFPHLLGCNCSFRRSALLEIGGFDEEFEYFLDETDVCARIVDSGYLIAQLPFAYVHHKYAPSNIRGENKVVRYRYPIIKNKIYFSFKHASDFHSIEEINAELNEFIKKQSDEVDWSYCNKLLTKEDVSRFAEDLKKAKEVGLKRGAEGVAPGAMIDIEKLVEYSGVFSPFKTISNGEHKSIVLVSRDYPPNHGGGVATFNQDLAEALAQQGNIVHVVTSSADIDRVDFENGVWIHRRIIKEHELSSAAEALNIPRNIWSWSSTALEEVCRIASHRKIDVIEAPIWDCEGIAFLIDGRWPLVTSLQTTLYFWLDSHPDNRKDTSWMHNFGNPMLELEKKIMLESDAIRSISRSIAKEIESAYEIKFQEESIKILPLGLKDKYETRLQEKKEWIEILFVGRLELRKGIDVLLESIPNILKSELKICFRLIGDDAILDSDGYSFKEKFLRKYSKESWINQVKFEGRVDQKTLLNAYSTCDVFVAPSRFESFGLVFLEAMRASKAVIGCNAGGMPEIIVDEINGLLVSPGDSADLTTAIMRLISDKKLREKLGLAGKQIFNEKFTSNIMAAGSMDLYKMAIDRFNA